MLKVVVLTMLMIRRSLNLRIHRCTWRSITELKRLLQEEWNKNAMQEAVACMAEMPGRYDSLVKKGGNPVKGDL